MFTFKGRSPSVEGTDTGPDTFDLEHVYAEYVGPIYRFLYARVGNREDAEDLTSQVFLKASVQLDAARAERSIASWLFTVARTVLADHWRKECRHGPLLNLQENMVARPVTADVADDSEKMRRVDEVLAALPPRSRRVLELRFLYGYTVIETSHALGITTGHVKVLQHRALARAARLMEYGSGHGVLSHVGDQAIA